MSTGEWDEKHRKAIQAVQQRGPESRATSADTPMPLLVQAVAGLKPGKALDLACGLGRNSLWLAERDWIVTAVDQSQTAIEFVRRCATKRNLPVNAIVADLEKQEFAIEPGAWDLIVICNYLQRDLFPKAKRGVAHGGLMVASALLASSHDPGSSQRFRVQPGELRTCFEDWTILRYQEIASPEKASGQMGDGVANHPSHATAEVVARRE
jgi:tellurite methyltransferase